MDASNALSAGWLHATFFEDESAIERFPNPIVQVLQVKTIKSDGGPERHRLVLSDGQLYCQGMVATQSHHLIAEQQLENLKIVRIKQYQKNIIKQKRILVILDLELIAQYGTPPKIGEPQGLPLVGEEGNLQPITGAGFYGVKEEQKPKPVGGASRPPVDSRHGGANIYPIEALSPYATKWTIRARVTNKSEIKYWKKPSGEGKLFSVNLLDESGEIRATGFNETVDLFYDLLQEGQVYYISNPCRVQMAKKQFTNLSNDYELTLERETRIEKAEDQTSVPQVRFNFCNVGELREVEKDSTVDIIGVLKEVHEVQRITSKTTNKPYEKRDLEIVDDSGYSVRVTIWGNTANSFDANPESVIAFKGVKVSDFGGKSLSLLSSGTMAVDPDIPDAHRLKGWYDSQGRTDTFSTHAGLASMGAATGRRDEAKLISEVKDMSLGVGEPTYFSLSATIVYIKQENFCYPACTSTDCNKKITDMGDGTWRCERCNKNLPSPEYRYIMQVNVCDHTGQLWLSCFDDTGRILMGIPANDLMQMREEGGDNQSAPVFENANCRRYSFRIRAKMDTFQEQERVRYQVMSCAPIDFKSDGNRLAELIKQYNISE